MRPRFLWVLAATLVPAPAFPGQDVSPIEHTALACVPVGRYASVAARSATTVARAELQFRGEADGGWYSVRMTEQDGEWAAFLPRPTSAVRRIEYRIVLTGPDSTSATSPAVSVPVQEACDGDALASVPSPIVITVPEGAPAVPPVPAGFAPAGVTLAAQKRGRNRGLKIAGAAAGALVLGATGIAVAGVISPDDPEPFILPELRLNSISPAPGSTIVRTREAMVVSMVMSHQPTLPLTLTWRVDFASSSAGRTCVEMYGHAFGVQPSLGLTFTAPVFVSAGGGCGEQAFETDTVRIVVSHHHQVLNSDELFHDSMHAIAYRFVP